MAGTQVVILLAFATASADILLRLHRALRNTRATISLEAQGLPADTKFQLFAAGLVLAFLTIFTGCCYRIAEMAGGWANPTIQNENGFRRAGWCDGLDCVAVSDNSPSGKLLPKIGNW
jgi:hypothetical protein